MHDDLKGKAVIVTGGANGIGRAYCEGLAAAGCHVVVADLDADGADALASSLSAGGANVSAVRVDIADEASVAAMVQHAVDVAGGVDVLVNNAGILPRGDERVSTEALTVEAWDRMLAVNLRGPFLCCRTVIPHMRAAGGGSIVNVSSDTFLTGSATRPHYVASKAGVVGLTRSLARELGPAGIRVNVISPGGTLSEPDPTPDIVAQREGAIASRALRRVQMPEDLVGALLFLASDASAFITGQTLVVNGGAFMQ